ncbi:MAG: cytochrome-c peroxidase [Proteobacteria bacterium]|nr:cytochrome-c peroxidase [Pseudomonadota bacterium]
MSLTRPMLFAAAFALVACTETEEGGELDYEYADASLPQHYQESGQTGNMMAPGFDAAIDFDNTPADNPITNNGAKLGRVLFYDTDLSQNRTISCASCHVQEFGFSDDEVLSIGFDGGLTGRHSMGLTNARFYGNGRFFWDQRAETLEAQVLMPMQDPVEMGMTLEEVVERVEEDERYAPLFEAAYGSDVVDTDRISKSIAQFVRSMVSTTSRYDEGRAEVSAILDDFPNFTAEENAGKTLFYAPPPMGGLGCAHCHGTDAQIGIGAISNGLDASVTDEGFGSVTGAQADMGTFKVPSLRNVGVRAPYMHDGRFESLEEVIEHYSTGVQFHPSLFPFLLDGNGGTQPLNLTAAEKAQLRAFLLTLTDDAMLTDPKFSDPGW